MPERRRVSVREERWRQLGIYEEPAAHIAVAETCLEHASELLVRMAQELARAKERLAELTDYPYGRT